MTFELSFNFPDEKAKGFDLINAALSNMELSDLRIAEQKGSLVVVQFADASKPKQYGYQLSEIALKCNQNTKTGNYHFQFDSAAFPWEECDEDKDYMETWKKNHPDREICFLQTVTYDAAKATVFNVLHREKTVEDWRGHIQQ